ncbi:UNVERIFIED_CONTAM: hypothetical protein K2H54_062596 [Gekko kuhli]
MTTTEEGDLQFPVQLEQGLQTDIKMEEESSTGPQLTDESRKAPHVLQAGTIGGFLQRSPGQDVKREQDEGQLQRWEVQWQEFLKTMEASQSSWKNLQLRGVCVSSGEVRAVPPLLRGQPVTICHTVGEHVSQDLLDPCEPRGRARNRLECGDFGQVKEETEGQGLKLREEAALNTPKAVRAPSDCWQMPVNREAEQEGDTRGQSCPAGKRFKSANEDEKSGLEGSNHMAVRDVSEGRANEMSFHNHRGESEHPQQLEHKGICSRAGIRGSFPSQGPKPVSKTVIQHRIHPGQKLPTVGGRSFQQSSALVKSEHTQASRKQYLCSDCGKTFFMFLALRTHQRTHMDQERSQTRGAGHTVGPVL